MELKVNGLIKRFGDFTAVDDVEILMTRGVYGLLESTAPERPR